MAKIFQQKQFFKTQWAEGWTIWPTSRKQDWGIADLSRDETKARCRLERSLAEQVEKDN